MLLKRRPPGISSEAAEPCTGFSHLEPSSVAVLRWLNANKVDFVVVGPVARAIRGDSSTTGPVAIVPAPYGRNWERLCTALVAERAGLRAEAGSGGAATVPSAVPVKLTAEKLARGRRWLLRFGDYDLDVEGYGPLAGDDTGPPVAQPGQQTMVGGRSGGEGRPAPGYQELLYEAGRFEIAAGVSVEVASPEDLEHYSHVRRTGSAPEFRISRKAHAEHETA